MGGNSRHRTASFVVSEDRQMGLFCKWSVYVCVSVRRSSASVSVSHNSNLGLGLGCTFLALLTHIIENSNRADIRAKITDKR